MPRVRLTRRHLPAIGAVTADGRVLMPVQTEAVRGPQVVRYLRHLLRHIPDKLLAIREGSPIHCAEVVNAFLAGGVARRLWLEQLPGYAPDLNPVEGLWQYLKRVRLGNICCHTLKEVRYEVHVATASFHETVLANLPKHYGCPL